MIEQGAQHKVQVRINIAASADRVWEALTRPELIKQYLFGTDVETDWKVGSPMVYRGEWKGKRYEDKGRILEMVPGRRFQSTYWSAFSGLPDLPENYQRITYELFPGKLGTTLTLTQENVTSAAAKAESEQNWRTVLEALKKLLEKA